jgi:lipopolysaccharide export system protein LptA
MRWLCATLMVAATAGAQPPSGPCRLVFENTDSTRATAVKLASGRYNTFLGNGVIAHCPAQNLTLISDSAESYDDQGVMYAIGHVHYTEPRAKMDADRAWYYQADARLIADGNVVAHTPSGSVMHGPHADYLRALPGVRAQAQMTATGRPHLDLVQRDSLGRPEPPVGVDANTIVSQNDSLIFASGRVDIDRTDLDAHGDSAYLDQGTEFMRLMGFTKQPVINGKQGRRFVLHGNVIDLYSHLRQLQRVKSYARGDVVSQDLHLWSDTIDLRVNNKQLERSYAWGPSRARATTPERDILADSIDAMLPGQVLRQVRSVGKAFAQSLPDTVKIKSKDKDWMRGDTIIAYFDSTTQRDPSDTSKQPEVKTVFAQGHAQSLYQLPPKDKRAKVPALNYVRGHNIEVQLAAREVKTVTVSDSVSGVMLEPIVEDTLKTKRDTINGSSRGRRPGGIAGRP